LPQVGPGVGQLDAEVLKEFMMGLGEVGSQIEVKSGYRHGETPY